jgi:hypothetical protein
MSIFLFCMRSQGDAESVMRLLEDALRYVSLSPAV